MAKRSRTRRRVQPAAGAVGPRQPCPCGSGRRYKACHGGADAVFVQRPFAGMPAECDVVAMRELVPAATAPLPLSGHPDRDVLLCTLLPGAAPAMVRENGAVWLGLQVLHNFGDPARDLGAVLIRAPEAAAPGPVGLTEPPGPGPRLPDLVVPTASLAVTVFDNFDFWAEGVEPSTELTAALEQAGAAVVPTARLRSVEAAYWTRIGPKEHLRWVMPEPEDELLTALARLHVAGQDVLIPESRLVGMFRAHGVLAPVWDLALDTGAAAVEDAAQAFGEKLAEALADTTALSASQRSARQGLANRQVTIR